MRHPVEAFSALIDDFRRHMRLQLSWLDVRQVLAQAEALRDQYLTCHNADCDSDCADRLRALALLPQYAAIAGELLHAASELDGRLQLIRHLAAEETKCA
jgi:hypothetical protein